MALKLWNDNTKQKIIANGGSIQLIDEIPDVIKAIYKTVWEISQKVVIDMAADRGAYICQSQSMNIFIDLGNPKIRNLFQSLSSMHFYAWKKGLKTGMYYLRLKQQSEAIKFTIDKNVENDVKLKREQIARQVEEERIAKGVREMFPETKEETVSTSQIKESTGFYDGSVGSDDDYTDEESDEDVNTDDDIRSGLKLDEVDNDGNTPSVNVQNKRKDDDDDNSNTNNEMFCPIGCTTCGS
jgi:ribonucleotide reductase alpha subunit